jgi:hypothetical protein
MITGEAVNLYQGAGHPVGEVVEWIPHFVRLDLMVTSAEWLIIDIIRLP